MMMMLVEWKYLMQLKCSQSLDGPLLYIIQIFDIKHFKTQLNYTNTTTICILYNNLKPMIAMISKVFHVQQNNIPAICTMKYSIQNCKRFYFQNVVFRDRQLYSFYLSCLCLLGVKLLHDIILLTYRVLTVLLYRCI